MRAERRSPREDVRPFIKIPSATRESVISNSRLFQLPRLRAACLMGEPGKESNFSPSTVLSRLPLQSAILGLITLSSAFALTNEVPALGGDRADPIGTAIDAGLALYGSVTLARQAGVLSAGEPPNPATAQGS